MRSRHVPMSFEEFKLMPHEVGWKHEFWDGQAHISPGHQVAVVNLPTNPRERTSAQTLRPVESRDREALIAAFVAAFGDTIEYCDWEPAKIAQSAEDAIDGFFSGARGRPHAASRIAMEPPDGRILGAALVTDIDESRSLLDMLFVLPDHQRRWLGSALVSAAIDALRAAGIGTMQSRYDVGNAASRAWHINFGFEELPNVLLARHYERHAAHELWRRKELGNLDPAERQRLEAELARCTARVHELEAIAEKEGLEAVMPLLRR
ncbi:MAG: GNAT family N-acetyltransferase [Planctomycetaceae bacterium]